MKKVANRYAVALFELALEEAKLDEYAQQLSFLRKVFDDQEVLAFLTALKIQAKVKKELIKNILDKQVDRHLVSFIMILIDKRRISLVKVIIDEFHSLVNQHYNIEEGIVYSIRPLSDMEHKDIEAAISKMLESKVVLKNYLNPHLISGIKVVVNDVVIDGSMQAKMAQLKAELLKESR